MGQIHSRKSITASADTDPQFEVHDQELMQIPLPLARAKKKNRISSTAPPTE